jgi:hypothetical protein
MTGRHARVVRRSMRMSAPPSFSEMPDIAGRRLTALDAVRTSSEHCAHMRSPNSFGAPLALCLLTVLLVPRVSPAADAGAAPGAVPPSAALPAARTADAILTDAVKATGGDAPWKTHHAIETKTQIEYAKMAISGTRTQTVTWKNKSLAVTSIPNVGEVKEGTNGRAVWADDPVNGLRLLTGAEAAQFKLESTWNLERNVKRLFPKITVKADTDGGRPLECLELTPRIGQPMTTCYDAETHLQVLQKGTAATPQGDVPFTSRIKGWKEFDGLKLPELVEMTTGPIDFSARLLDVVFDKPVDERMFELPPAKPRGGARAKIAIPTN